MRIRTVYPLDAGEISALICTLVDDYLAPDVTPEGKVTLLKSVSPEAINSYLSDARYRYHVVVDGDRIAGVVAMRDNNHVYHLFVCRAYQGLGLARLLWKKAQKTCEQHGNTGRYTVNASSYARGFYERLGFRPVGQTETRDGVTTIPMELVVISVSGKR